MKLRPAEVDQTLTELRKVADFVSPTRTLTTSPDESDNRFLERASAGHANYLVTGNKRHFPARYGDIEIVKARELIQLFAPGLRREQLATLHVRGRSIRWSGLPRSVHRA